MRITYLSVSRDGRRLQIEFREVETGAVRTRVEWYPTDYWAAAWERVILNRINKSRVTLPPCGSQLQDSSLE